MIPLSLNYRDDPIYEEIECRNENILYEEIKTEKDDQKIVVLKQMSPTGSDTPYNRYYQFLLYTVTEFNQNACIVILISTDKSNVKTSKYIKYLNKTVDGGVTVGLSAAGVLSPIAKSAGKITGELVEGLLQEYEKSKQHNKGKLAEHLLKSFEPDDSKWIWFLLDCFSTIFIR